MKDGALNSIRKASELFVKGKVDETFTQILDAHHKCREWYFIFHSNLENILGMKLEVLFHLLLGTN